MAPAAEPKRALAEIPFKLAQLRDLISEQEPSIVARAAADKSPITVLYMANSDYLVLLVVRRDQKPKVRRYDCRLLHVEDREEILPGSTTQPETPRRRDP